MNQSQINNTFEKAAKNISKANNKATNVMKIDVKKSKTNLYIVMFIFLLAIILCIVALAKKETCIESFDGNDKEEILEKIRLFSAEIDALKNSQPQSYTIKHINNPIAYASPQGTYYASGPLVNKVLNNMVLDRNSSTTGDTTPIFTPATGFLDTTQIWSYEVDGTIRSKYDKVDNKLGSCITGKKQGDKYVVVLEGGNGNCSKWIWDSKGRLRINSDIGQGSKNLCIVPSKISGTDKKTVILDTCSDTATEHHWSFYTGPPPSTDNN